MIKKNLKIFIIFIAIVLGYTITSKAAISASSKEVESGGKVSVLVTSDVPVSAYSVTLTGSNGLTFVTSTGGTGAGGHTISDAKASGGMTGLATFTFTAPTVEQDTTYTVSFSATGMGDVNLNPIQDSTCSASIKVKAKTASNNNNTSNSNQNNNNKEQNQQTPAATKSNVATLSNLGIKPNDFSGFTPSKTEYSVTVPNDVSSVEVYAYKGKDSNGKEITGQSVSGTGKKNLQEGTNTFKVVVTAEDGKTQKTYTINVVRKAAEEKTEENNTTENNTTEDNTVKDEKPKEEQEETKIGLATLKIDGVTLSPTFKQDVYKYTAKLIGDKTSLDIKKTALDESQKIEVIGNEDLKEGENIITILVSDKEEENTVTYQITVNKSLIDEEAVAKEKQAQEKEKQKRFIIIGITAAAIVIIAIILIVRHRRNAQYEMEYTEPYFENDWDNQNNTFESNQNENNQFVNNFEENENIETKEDPEENNQKYKFEELEDKPKRKKPSKGKRFK